LKPRQLIHLLGKVGCRYYREGRGDHRLAERVREAQGRKRVVPIDMGARELSPVYVLRVTKVTSVMRQFGLTDADTES
jgi:hypothetical protein